MSKVLPPIPGKVWHFMLSSVSGYYIIFFGHKNSLFGHNRFSTLFFSMKIAESEKIVLASCMIEFKDIQVWLRHFSLNRNACRVMTVFFKIRPEILKTFHFAVNLNASFFISFGNRLNHWPTGSQGFSGWPGWPGCLVQVQIACYQLPNRPSVNSTSETLPDFDITDFDIRICQHRSHKTWYRSSVFWLQYRAWYWTYRSTSMLKIRNRSKLRYCSNPISKITSTSII